VTVKTVTKFGRILVDQKGLALYYDTANKPGKWACTKECLTFWPPLLLPKGQTAPAGGTGVTGLGAVNSPSGRQVAWDGKALYTFKKDKAGEVNGQGVGKVWFVVQLKPSNSGIATTTTTVAMTSTTAAVTTTMAAPVTTTTTASGGY
jgi:predicted lipoprotein with Yx(FWY)xxD motif